MEKQIEERLFCKENGFIYKFSSQTISETHFNSHFSHFPHLIEQYVSFHINIFYFNQQPSMIIICNSVKIYIHHLKL